MEIPSEPTPNLIKVTNVNASTSEKSLRDFFLFCGRIKDMELKPDGDDSQAALILFENSKAASTATLLTDGKKEIAPISGAPEKPIAGEPTVEGEENRQQESTMQADESAKPVSKVMAELMAAGYRLGDQVLAKGIEFDHKYGVRETVQKYFDQLRQNLHQLDQQYHLTEKTSDIEQKVQEKQKLAADKAQDWLQNNPTGQKVGGLAKKFADQINELHGEAKRIIASG
ncbi:hypothetical protein DM01DRAFT_1399457 [Hesseltinella vesiculosa]|uniref:RRM domain-containing protein n=1 Tax=Hesseltinella vesiculosa TaxID=101127 RepID=A0A1X2G3H2_9FUNG|nr:hypothetical protein DM01DRAFT_1399457 [Hesseltinella vesiculosa]